MRHVIDIEWWRLALGFLAIVVLVVLSRGMRLGLERSYAIATARGSIQLLAIGYVLGAIFAIDHPALVLGTLLVMLAVAASTAASRLPRRLPGIALLATGSLVVGTALSLTFMTAVVISVRPWYDPHYVIPLGGMMLGNSMNAASLAGDRFQEELRSRRDEVETMLALGFSGSDSLHPPLARSLRAAMIPTINSFTVAGLVQLPGIMTGQIISGVDPIIAVKYQILVFLMLMLTTGVSTWLFLLLLRRRYLTPAHQFRRELTMGEYRKTGRRR